MLAAANGWILTGRRSRACSAARCVLLLSGGCGHAGRNCRQRWRIACSSPLAMAWMVASGRRSRICRTDRLRFQPFYAIITRRQHSRWGALASPNTPEGSRSTQPATTMAHAPDTVPLIRTKLRRPWLPEDLVSRPRLLEKLHRGLGCKLTLISAQAGAGKSTLLAQWLTEVEPVIPSAWISLDQSDNDLILFMNYVCEAIRTVFPTACGEVMDLLRAAETPPARVITALLVNEMDSLREPGDRSLNR